jgi:hypothetical protein
MINVKKYRNKPVVVEAMIFTGANADEVDKWINGEKAIPGWGTCTLLAIETLEGTMYAQVGDYIIRGVNGEFYPCKPDIFTKTYETLEEL